MSLKCSRFFLLAVVHFGVARILIGTSCPMACMWIVKLEIEFITFRDHINSPYLHVVNLCMDAGNCEYCEYCTIPFYPVHGLRIP